MKLKRISSYYVATDAYLRTFCQKVFKAVTILRFTRTKLADIFPV